MSCEFIEGYIFEICYFEQCTHLVSTVVQFLFLLRFPRSRLRRRRRLLHLLLLERGHGRDDGHVGGRRLRTLAAVILVGSLRRICLGRSGLWTLKGDGTLS